jgi:hypothetical protein
MKTRGAGKQEMSSGETMQPRKGRVRKGTGGKKGGAVMTKRLVLRGKKSSSREGSRSTQAADESREMGGDLEAGKPHADRVTQLGSVKAGPLVPAAARRRQGAASDSQHMHATASIESLSTEALQHVFVQLCNQDDQQLAYCR